MKKLILLSINLIHAHPIYQIYLELYKTGQIINPIIFSDNCTIGVDKSIPVLTIFHMKQLNKISQPINILCSDIDYEIMSGLCEYGNYIIVNTMNKPNVNYNAIPITELQNKIKETI